jgi:polyhydroxyalkanoate synthesis regulator phasin
VELVDKGDLTDAQAKEVVAIAREYREKSCSTNGAFSRKVRLSE